MIVVNALPYNTLEEDNAILVVSLLLGILAIRWHHRAIQAKRATIVESPWPYGN